MEEETKKEFVDIGNVRTEDQRVWYQKIIDEGIDPFEENYFKKNHPNPIIHENDSWILTTNAVPYSNCKLHFLIISKRFIMDTRSVDKKSWNDLHEVFLFVESHYRIDGYAFFMRSGDTKRTGASVVRLHAHIVVPDGHHQERNSIYPVIL